MSNRDRLPLLRRTLESLIRQRPPFEWEVIVVNHGGAAETETLCEEYRKRGLPLRYAFLPSPRYANPAPARNLACKMARGDVLVMQSSEVVHARPDTVERLVADLAPKTFLLARVADCVLQPGTFQPMPRRGVKVYVADSPPDRRRPLFFLGAILREHICEIGGNSEQFTRPGFEDSFLADCLLKGLGLKDAYSPSIAGYHQRHPRPRTLGYDYDEMRRLHKQLAAKGVWRGGEPWPYRPGVSVLEIEKEDARPHD